jgi:spermidine/putrescine transport system substrate-binding protein
MNRILFTLVLLSLGGLAACSTPQLSPVPTVTPAPLAQELTFCDYIDDLPQPVLDAFTAETGIQIRYRTFESMEEAIVLIGQGNACDVVNLDVRYTEKMIQAGSLAKLNKANLPNLKNISADFRDMAYDPHNDYTIPYNWGTSGLLVRSDLVSAAHWSDLWNPEFTGKIGIWRGEPRDGIGLALIALGYSVNSENPMEINAAVDHLIELGPRVVFLDDEDQVYAADYLNEGKISMSLGWAADAIEGRRLNPDIHYILPEEGAMMWGENFVIPVGSLNPRTAEVLINYFLQPKVSAQITNLSFYATPNQAARDYILPEILNDPLIFPSNAILQKTEILLPISAEGQKIFDEAWARFLEAVETK